MWSTLKDIIIFLFSGILVGPLKKIFKKLRKNDIGTHDEKDEELRQLRFRYLRGLDSINSEIDSHRIRSILKELEVKRFYTAYIMSNDIVNIDVKDRILALIALNEILAKRNLVRELAINQIKNKEIRNNLMKLQFQY